MEHTELIEEPGSGESAEGSSRRQRWIRPNRDRLIAGVAVGIADATRLPLWLVRAAFVVGTILGGFGLAAYIVAWVLMRGEGEDESAVDAWIAAIDGADTTSAKIGIALMVAAGLLALGALGLFSAPLVVAVLLLVIGLKLVSR